MSVLTRIVKPNLGITNICSHSLIVLAAEKGKLKLSQQLFLKLRGATMAQ